METSVQVVANAHCVTGENPLWNQREGRIYWEDIDTGRLFRADHLTREHECFYRGAVLGGFTFQEDRTLLLFRAPIGSRRSIRRSGDAWFWSKESIPICSASTM